MTCLRVWRGSCISQWRCGLTFGGGHAGECEASDIRCSASEITKAKVIQCINRTTRSTDEKTAMSALRVSLVSLLGRVVCCISSVTW